jgi:hypothetical protein
VKNTFKCQVDDVDSLRVIRTNLPSPHILRSDRSSDGSCVSVYLTDKQALRLAALLVANVQGV